jgi:hypothetical protein
MTDPTVRDLVGDCLDLTLDTPLPAWAADLGFSAETRLASLLHLALELAIKVPVPDNWGADRKARAHQDLGDMTDYQLWQQLKRIELFLAISEDDPPHPWYAERMKVIQAEQQRRKRIGKP